MRGSSWLAAAVILGSQAAPLLLAPLLPPPRRLLLAPLLPPPRRLLPLPPCPG